MTKTAWFWFAMIWVWIAVSLSNLFSGKIMEITAITASSGWAAISVLFFKWEVEK